MPDNPYLWDANSVSKILARFEYCGHTVNFKTYSKSNKLKKRYENTPENRRIFRNTHEAIIDEKLFERVLSLQPDNVSAMLGLGIGFLHTPAIFGGSNEKALEWFLKAQAAAVEPYERYAADVWLSQYYFKIDDEQNYRLFVDKAKTLFPNGYLLNQALERNENERKPL